MSIASSSLSDETSCLGDYEPIAILSPITTRMRPNRHERIIIWPNKDSNYRIFQQLQGKLQFVKLKRHQKRDTKNYNYFNFQTQLNMR